MPIQKLESLKDPSEPPSETENEEEVNEDVNIVTKFAFATRVGYIPNSPYKVNQDNFLLNPNMLKLPAFHFFGVCDGHGQNGKDVSTYIKKRLPLIIEEKLKNKDHHDKELLYKVLDESFDLINTDLDFVPFDCQFSGTTLCTVLFIGNKLISANAGDSRAIVVRKSPLK